MACVGHSGSIGQAPELSRQVMLYLFIRDTSPGIEEDRIYYRARDGEEIHMHNG